MATFISFAGWAGAGCMLLAFGLLSTSRIQAGPVFQTLNLCGAFGLLVSGATVKAWPSVTLNLAWVLISLAALARQREHAEGPPLTQWRKIGHPRAKVGDPRRRLPDQRDAILSSGWTYRPWA